MNSPKVRIEKISSLENKEGILPDNYWLEGNLLLLKVGSPLLVFRTKNKRGSIPGEFSTSIVKDIINHDDYTEVVTKNSKYKIYDISNTICKI